MKPTEHEATVAVDAAARRYFVQLADPAGVQFYNFDTLTPLAQNELREAVLPIVWAALEALPDRREAALRAAAERCCTCHTGDTVHDDWCVSTGVLAEMAVSS